MTAGWVTTEVGRQPCVVYGHLRTADAVTPFLTTRDVIASLLAYIVVYCARLRRGRVLPRSPRARADSPTRTSRHEPKLGERPARPLSAATDLEASP